MSNSSSDMLKLQDHVLDIVAGQRIPAPANALDEAQDPPSPTPYSAEVSSTDPFSSDDETGTSPTALPHQQDSGHAVAQHIFQGITFEQLCNDFNSLPMPSYLLGVRDRIRTDRFCHPKGPREETFLEAIANHQRAEHEIALAEQARALGIKDEDLEQGLQEGDHAFLEDEDDADGEYGGDKDVSAKRDEAIVAVVDSLVLAKDAVEEGGRTRDALACRQMSEYELAVKVNNILVAFRERPVCGSASYTIDISRAIDIIGEDQFCAGTTRALLRTEGFFFINVMTVGLPSAVHRWLEGVKDDRKMMEYSINIIDAAVSQVRT